MATKDKIKKGLTKYRNPEKYDLHDPERYLVQVKARQKKGDYNALYSLARIYNIGETVKRNPKKAIRYYEMFFKIYLKKRTLLDEVEEFINMSKLYKELGNDSLAKEYLLKAGFEIMRKFPDDDKEQVRQQKRYNLDKLLKESDK